ncbi:MAG: GGDEF domain-containing protein [Clostridiales bacterium]|nr:GGDEF domain-containing protein [Clostridiales bacterium]
MTVQEHDSAMKQLEFGVRKGLEHFMRIMIIVCFVLEIGLGIYFYITDTLYQTVLRYSLQRVLLPCAINIALFLLMYFCNRSPKFTDEIKNRVCSTAFLMFCGELAIIHSYFIPIWMLSFFALMFSGIFHDHYFHKVQAGLCMFFILAAGATHIIDYPDQADITVQYIIVSIVVGAAVTYFAFRLEKFSSSELLINIEIAEGAMKYKAGYEFDSLTGVYSRAHLEEAAHSVFSLNGNMSHVGVAMIDIDNFKHVNDNYGHDNGDIVLKKLGEYLGRFNTRESFCGRYGGEEFVIVFRNANKKEDLYELDNLRKLFEETSFPFADKPITISIGYHKDRTDSDWESALKSADDALYESKRTGKNKITVKD